MERPPVEGTLAKRIRQLRLQRKLSAQQLADLCAELGMSSLTRGVIAKIESGIRKTVTAEESAVLARALGVPIADLLASEYESARDDRRRINPFEIPDWSPRRPLAPWRVSMHRDYYVDVGDLEQQFRHFVMEMGDLRVLMEFGRTVLVTGESGCGKSALINRCADWVVQRVYDHGLRGEIIDVTAALVGRPDLAIEQRMSIAGGFLFDGLRRRGVLWPDAADRLRDARDRPDWLFPGLSDALEDDRVLIVLLPPVELADEVLRYAALARGRVVFMIESAYLGEDDARDIVEKLAQWEPPVTLHSSPLRAGDVRRFVSDRLRRHRATGSYPGVSEDALELLSGQITSIAQLNRILYDCFETWRRSDRDYDDTAELSPHDILEFMHSVMGRDLP